MSEQSFPLFWPLHIPRTRVRQSAKFSTKKDTEHGWKRSERKSLTEALDALESEYSKLDVSGVVLSTNLSLRLDGLPKAGQAKPSDPGAAFYFTRKGQRICMPCDKWDRVEDNIYAIAMHIGAMRGMERWGVGTTEQAFAGYKALTSGEDWWVVLACRPNASRAEIDDRYRFLARSAHPDAGGSNDAMARINKAREEALLSLKGATA